MTKNEYLELLQGLKKKKCLYYAEIEKIKKRTRKLSTEVDNLTDRYIDSNSVYKIGDRVIFKYNGGLYFVLAVSMTRDYEIVYSLTDYDIAKDLEINGSRPVCLVNCLYPTVKKSQLTGFVS